MWLKNSEGLVSNSTFALTAKLSLKSTETVDSISHFQPLSGQLNYLFTINKETLNECV